MDLSILGPPESTWKLTSAYSPHILKIFGKHINLIANSALNDSLWENQVVTEVQMSLDGSSIWGY